MDLGDFLKVVSRFTEAASAQEKVQMEGRAIEKHEKAGGGGGTREEEGMEEEVRRDYV